MRARLSLAAIVVALPLASATQTADSLQKYTLSAPGITASFIGYGARLTNLYVTDKDGTSQDVVLGYDQGSEYVNDTEHEHTYFGAVVGRYAGRMRNGTFTLQGMTSHVAENENNGQDSLHGGKVGYDQRNWTIVCKNKTSITFVLEDNEFEGYPGRVINYATFSVLAAAEEGPSLTSRIVSIPIDGPTPIMLTTHPYWNLNAFVDAARPNVLDHTLHMPYSTRYIEIDNIEVATGGIASVKDRPGLLDFTSPHTLGESIGANVQACGSNCTGIDTNFVIDRPPLTGTESNTIPVLSLSSNVTGIKFDLYTNQQALIVYTCNKLNGTIPLKKSQQHSRDHSTVYATEHGCVAIETQGWVDGVNHPEWGQQEYQVFSSDTPPSVMWVKYVFGVV